MNEQIIISCELQKVGEYNLRALTKYMPYSLKLLYIQEYLIHRVFYFNVKHQLNIIPVFKWLTHIYLKYISAGLGFLELSGYLMAIKSTFSITGSFAKSSAALAINAAAICPCK